MQKSTKKNLIIAAGYALVLIFGMFIGPKFERESANSKNGSFLFGGRTDKIEKVIQIIHDNYVDPIKIDTIKEAAIQEILHHLDPHSTYLPPSEARMLNQDLEGNFDGIGIEYYILEDTLTLTSVTPDAPAWRSGLSPGDQILQINNKNITGIHITNRQVIETIRGKKGTTLELTIKTKGFSDVRKIRVIRDKIVISSIDAAYMLDPQNGYVKISKFGAQTNEDFEKALSSLQKKGLKNLVLDLRGNGGGYLSAATALADQFLGDKKLIVYTQGAHEPRTDYYATDEGLFEQGKLVILINENSASASEIVAGAIQDLDRGTIIGRRSFGKGLVQEQFDFGDGSALNLTIARYYTPSGRSIQRAYDKGAKAYYDEVAGRLKNGELTSARKSLRDSAHNNSKTYKTSSGKMVYGGGGIMPDIFVAADTSGYTDFYQALQNKGLLNDFVFGVLSRIPKPASVAEFISSYDMTEQQYQQLIALATTRGINVSQRSAALSRPVIATDLKALLGRYFFGDEGFYRIINQKDRAIAQSQEVLKK